MKMHIVVGGEARPIPGLDSIETGSVYHYTSAGGLEGIINSKCLWAASALQMNDESEIAYAAELVHQVARERSSNAARTVEGYLTPQWVDTLRASTFIASASRVPDLLTQWVHYAGALGYCIELDVAQTVVPFTDGPAPAHVGIVDGNPSFGWYPVLYLETEQRAAIEAVLDFLEEYELAEDPFDWRARQVVGSIFAVLLPQLKHPAFRDEREVRHICYRQGWTTERHRAGSFGLVPYIELRRADGDGYAATTDSVPLPVTSVLVGPTPGTEKPAAIDAVRRLLATHLYPEVPVTVSEIPYRYPRTR
jgi:hypothetical protein